LRLIWCRISCETLFVSQNISLILFLKHSLTHTRAHTNTNTHTHTHTHTYTLPHILSLLCLPSIHSQILSLPLSFFLSHSYIPYGQTRTHTLTQSHTHAHTLTRIRKQDENQLVFSDVIVGNSSNVQLNVTEEKICILSL